LRRSLSIEVDIFFSRTDWSAFLPAIGASPTAPFVLFLWFFDSELFFFSHSPACLDPPRLDVFSPFSPIGDSSPLFLSKTGLWGPKSHRFSDVALVLPCLFRRDPLSPILIQRVVPPPFLITICFPVFLSKMTLSGISLIPRPPQEPAWDLFLPTFFLSYDPFSRTPSFSPRITARSADLLEHSHQE